MFVSPWGYWGWSLAAMLPAWVTTLNQAGRQAHAAAFAASISAICLRRAHQTVIGETGGKRHRRLKVDARVDVPWTLFQGLGARRHLEEGVELLEIVATAEGFPDGPVTI